MARDSIVIVGTGRAGSRAAEALREEGFSGRVTMVGEEMHPPYDRPPLSKERLFGTDRAQIGALYAADFFAERDIEWRPGLAASSVDRQRHAIALADGEVVPYDRLLLATGSSSRRLPIPGSDLAGIHTLRSLDDSRHLALQLVPGRRLTIIGGGLIGLEVAAGAVARGLDVVVLEAAPRLMSRAVPPAISIAVQAAHEARGVRFILGAAITHFAGTGRLSAIHLGAGRVIDTDLALVAIGGAPRIELAQSAGLEIDSGIVTDDTLQTSDPDIFAAGDVASFMHPLFARRLRLEHWHNAEEQGRHVGRNLLHAAQPYGAVPWFWSDQFDLSLQGVGLGESHRTSVRNLADSGLAVFHVDADDRLVGATAFGPTGPVGRTVSLARKMIGARTRVAPARLADPATDLKKLLTESLAT